LYVKRASEARGCLINITSVMTDFTEDKTDFISVNEILNRVTS